LIEFDCSICRRRRAFKRADLDRPKSRLERVRGLTKQNKTKQNKSPPLGDRPFKAQKSLADELTSPEKRTTNARALFAPPPQQPPKNLSEARPSEASGGTPVS
jgi:hypothetical protein